MAEAPSSLVVFVPGISPMMDARHPIIGPQKMMAENIASRDAEIANTAITRNPLIGPLLRE